MFLTRHQPEQPVPRAAHQELQRDDLIGALLELIEGAVARMHAVEKRAEMKVPGLFFLESGFSPAGNGLREGNRDGIIEFRNFQAMTPETEHTTHFFWIYMHNQKKDIELISHSLHDSILEGFHEDKVLIEMQQKVLDADPQFKLKAIAADAPLSHLRWVIEKRIKQESSAAREPADAR